MPRFYIIWTSKGPYYRVLVPVLVLKRVAPSILLKTDASFVQTEIIQEN